MISWLRARPPLARYAASNAMNALFLSNADSPRFHCARRASPTPSVEAECHRIAVGCANFLVVGNAAIGFLQRGGYRSSVNRRFAEIGWAHRPAWVISYISRRGAARLRKFRVMPGTPVEPSPVNWFGAVQV
jgi:hypothetical protein